MDVSFDQHTLVHRPHGMIVPASSLKKSERADRAREVLSSFLGA